MSSDLKCRFLFEDEIRPGIVHRIYRDHSDLTDQISHREMTVANRYIIFGDDFKDQDIDGDLQRHASFRCLNFSKCRNYTRHNSEFCNYCRINKCAKKGCLKWFIQESDEEFCWIHLKSKKYT